MSSCKSNYFFRFPLCHLKSFLESAKSIAAFQIFDYSSLIFFALWTYVLNKSIPLRSLQCGFRSDQT